MKTGHWAHRFEDMVFRHRPLVIAVFAMVSLALAVSATRLEIDAGFEKHLPGSHPFMQVFTKHQGEFGGANRLLIAVRARTGDIFSAPFLSTLREVTDAVFFLPGVNKASVRSLFTPNVRFVEVVRGGFTGGNVVPHDYRGSDEDMKRVRANVLKAGIVGRLVANDLSAAMVTAELVEVDPQTGKRLDYIEVAHLLEERLRLPHSDPDTEIHIIGFAKMVGDIADGAGNVLMFFAIAFVLSSIPVYLFTRSARHTGLLLLCSIMAVVWTLGFLSLFGFAIDPMSILVPFLVLAIGVSHGVQVAGAAGAAIRDGATAPEAALTAFRPARCPGNGGPGERLRRFPDHADHRRSNHPRPRDDHEHRRGGDPVHQPLAPAGPDVLCQARVPHTANACGPQPKPSRPSGTTCRVWRRGRYPG